MGANLVPIVRDFSIHREEADQHSISDGCVEPGFHRLMRFDFLSHNIGNEDLVVGAPSDHPEWFVPSASHGHFHLKDFNEFVLLDLDGNEATSGYKQAFCLIDLEHLSPWGPATPQFTNCNENQGVSAGWADLYEKSLACQFIVLDEVPDGDYVLRSTTNAQRLIHEDTYDDNTIYTHLRIAGDSVTKIGIGFRLRMVSGYTAGGGERYAGVWEVRPGPAWVARHALTSAAYQQEFTTLTGQGFRLTCVSGYEVGGQDRYAAIWEQRSGPAWVARHGLSSAAYQQAFNDLGAQGFRLTHVDGYTVGGEDRYAAIWEQRSGPAWVARHGLTSADYQQAFDDLTSQGYRLTCISGYEVGGQARYAGVWEQRPGAAWVARHGLSAADYQQAFTDLTATGFRLAHVSGYAVGGQDRYAAIWEQRPGPAWVARHGLSSAAYQQTFTQLVNAG